jgi:hypothetical protein
MNLSDHLARSGFSQVKTRYHDSSKELLSQEASDTFALPILVILTFHFHFSILFRFMSALSFIFSFSFSTSKRVPVEVGGKNQRMCPACTLNFLLKASVRVGISNQLFSNFKIPYFSEQLSIFQCNTGSEHDKLAQICPVAALVVV